MKKLNSKEISHQEFLVAKEIILNYLLQLNKKYDEAQNTLNKLGDVGRTSKDSLLKNAPMSATLYNRLRYNCDWLKMGENWHQITVNDLSKVSETDFLKVRNVGKKTLAELKELCFWVGISLKP